MTRVFWFFVLLSIAPKSGLGHELIHTVTDGKALVVSFFFADRTPFSFAKYEIIREGQKTPFQVGETDRHGRIAFLPNGEGTWHLKVYSEDGHGVEISLKTDSTSALVDAEKPLFDRYPRIITGLGLIFGLFGLATLIYGRRKR
jgi:nickel transport protein